MQYQPIAIVGDLPPYPVVLLLTLLASQFPTWIPFFMPHKVSPDRVWKNEKVSKEYTSKRRREMRLSAGGSPFCLGTALGLVNALENVREVAIPGLSVPFHVSHGTHDYGVPVTGTEYLLEHSTTPEDKRGVNIIEGAYHDLLSDDAREEIVASIIDWMDSNIE